MVQYGAVQRLSYSRIEEPIELPNLIQVQLSSYKWFLEQGLREALQEVFPISDFTGNLELNFIDYSLGDPKYSVTECKERDVSFQAPLKLRVRLTDKENGEIKESEVYMGDLPLMTEKGTFIINGAERVVVSQLVKSPGVYFSDRLDVAGNRLFGATIIPNRGAWFELEMDSTGAIYTRIDKTRKIPVTVLLRSIGYETNEAIQDIPYFFSAAFNHLFGALYVRGNSPINQFFHYKGFKQLQGHFLGQSTLVHLQAGTDHYN